MPTDLRPPCRPDRTTVRRFSSSYKLLVLVSAAALLAGCQNMSNRDAGTAIGAVAGGVAGAFLGKGAGKAVAIMAGTAIGAFIGNQIGATLDETQKAAIAQASANTLDAAAAGETIVWNDGKAQAQIVAGQTRYEPKPVVVVRDRKVEPPRALQLVGADHRVTGGAPVRLAARASSGTVATLKKGDTIHVVGREDGSGYSLVSRNRKSIGYVETAKLTPLPASAPPVQTAMAAPQSFGGSSGRPAASAAGAPALRPAVNLDDNGTAGSVAQAAAQSQGIDLDAEGAVAETVVASVPCRDLTTTISSQGQSDTSTGKACKASDGAWEL